MIRIRLSRPDDAERALQIWRDAVDATHHFLSPGDRSAIESEVRSFLPATPLCLAVDEDDVVTGFMVLTGGHIDALFVDPARHGQGVGRALVEHGVVLHPAITTDVNAQNEGAAGFYTRLGFIPTGRSDTDDQGRPYPLVHLRREKTPDV
jgi:putative acetyltransferase